MFSVSVGCRLRCCLTFSLATLVLVVAGSPAAAQLVWHDLVYEPDAPVLNPYKGFMDYAPGEVPGSEEFPHSLEFFYIGMDEFYDDTPQPVSLEAPDFTALELELEGIRSRGRQAVFRIFIDFPEPLNGADCPTYGNQAALEAAAMASVNFALPEFLYSSMTVGEYCAMGDSFGFQPDYTNNTLLTEIEDLVAAIDAEYDSQPGDPLQNDPRIAFIEVGFLGHWGEWHTFLDSSDPLQCGVSDFTVHDAMDRVLDAFDPTEGSFANTRTVVSADLLQCHLHFDGNKAPTAGVSFLRSIGIHDDDFANSTVCDAVDGYQARADFWAIDEDWRSLSIGGEVQPSIQEQIHADDDGLDCGGDPDTHDSGELNGAVDGVHASWLLQFNLFEPPGGSTPPMQFSNAEDTARRMGYQLYVAEVALPDEIYDSEPLDLIVRMENRGVAPIAYDLPVDLVVLDGAVEVASFALDADMLLRDVIDASPVDFAAQVNGHALPPQTYDLALRVLNPMVGGPALRFANVEQDGDLLMIGSLVVLQSAIFSDGFESGDLTAWSSTNQ